MAPAPCSSRRPCRRGLQAAASWAAGIGATALAGSGVGLRLALAGDVRGCGAWLAGCHARAAGIAWIYPALAAALFTVAWIARARRATSLPEPSMTAFCLLASHALAHYFCND